MSSSFVPGPIPYVSKNFGLIGVPTDHRFASKVTISGTTYARLSGTTYGYLLGRLRQAEDACAAGRLSTTKLVKVIRRMNRIHNAMLKLKEAENAQDSAA